MGTVCIICNYVRGVQTYDSKITAGLLQRSILGLLFFCYGCYWYIYWVTFSIMYFMRVISSLNIHCLVCHSLNAFHFNGSLLRGHNLEQAFKLQKNNYNDSEQESLSRTLHQFPNICIYILRFKSIWVVFVTNSHLLCLST